MGGCGLGQGRDGEEQRSEQAGKQNFHGTFLFSDPIQPNRATRTP